MAKIGTYENAPSPVSSEDKLIGTDSVNNDATKNFTVQEITDFVWDNEPYMSYIAKITQESNAAPIVDYLIKNTLSSPVTFSYLGTGSYRINCSNFNLDKTIIFIQNGANLGSTALANSNTGYIGLTSSNASGALANDILSNACIEIRVYP